jgi:hypothetical protein
MTTNHNNTNNPTSNPVNEDKKSVGHTNQETNDLHKDNKVEDTFDLKKETVASNHHSHDEAKNQPPTVKPVDNSK